MKPCQSHRKLLSILMLLALLAAQIPFIPVKADSAAIMVALGADLTPAQREQMLSAFNVQEGSVQIITVSNADERALLTGKFTDEQIGYNTYSSAMVHITSSGGVQAKTMNLNVVTANMIISALTTGGVTNCEVIANSPFLVSGTGALTGVLKAYELLNGTQLDSEKVEVVGDEVHILSILPNDVGADAATLIVNDIKIKIIRDGVAGEAETKQVVDETIASIENELAELNASGTRSEVSDSMREELYSYAGKISQIEYDYNEMKLTLQRVTNNVVKDSGIEDPITETFEDLSHLDVLPEDSILTQTNDAVMGEGTIITATNEAALTAEPVSPVEIPAEEPVTGVVLNHLWTINGSQNASLINGSNLLQLGNKGYTEYQPADLIGKPLTQQVYSSIRAESGLLKVESVDDGACGVLSMDGTEVVPLQYEDLNFLTHNWVIGITLKETTSSDSDYQAIFSDKNYVIDRADVYYIDGNQSNVIFSLTRDQYARAHAKGNYINIQDRTTESVTTYDSAGNVIAEGGSYFADYGDLPVGEYSFFTEPGVNYGKYGIKDGEGNVVVPPSLDTSGTFYGDYATISGEPDPETYESDYGLINANGETILPAEFDRIRVDPNPPLDSFGESPDLVPAKGYFLVVKDDKAGYAIQGGTITCPFQYNDDDIQNHGASFVVDNGDGTYQIVSADGVDTKVDLEGSRPSALNYADGLLYQIDSTLYDWHGNVLLEGYDDVDATGDGHYLAARLRGGKDLEIYEILYPTASNPTGERDSSDEFISAWKEESGSEAGESVSGPEQDTKPAENNETAAPVVTAFDEPVTGVSLQPLWSINESQNASLVNGSSILQIDETRSSEYRPADLSGKPLTEQSYYSIGAEYGFLQVRSVDEGAYGALTMDGTEVVPLEYDDLRILTHNWVIGITLKETASSDYDYSAIFGNKNYVIDRVDVYYIDGNQSDVIVSLSRDQYAHAIAKGNYINFEDRTTQSVTTYDAAGNVIDTGVDYYGDFGDLPVGEYSFYTEPGVNYGKYGIKDGEGNVVVPPSLDTSGTFYGEYALISGPYDPDTYESSYGLINAKGETILPAEFDDIEYNPNSPLNSFGKEAMRFNAKGYYLVVQDDKAGYAVKGGSITCPFQYGSDEIRNNGASFVVDNGDGTYQIVSADGIDTKVDLEGNEPRALYYADGLLYEVGSNLYDWHGTLLLEGYEDMKVTGDGHYLAAHLRGSRELEIFEILYPTASNPEGKQEEAGNQADSSAADTGSSETDAGSAKADDSSDSAAADVGSDSVAADTGSDSAAVDTDSGSAAAQAGTASSSGSDIIRLLQETDEKIRSIDLAANQEAVSNILAKEIEAVKEVSELASLQLSTAKDLIDSGSADPAVLSSLLQSAVAMLQAQ